MSSEAVDNKALLDCQRFVDDCCEFHGNCEHVEVHLHDDCHQHNHNVPLTKSVSFRIMFMIGLTGLYFLVELITAWLTNSLSLLSDSLHMLSDVAGLIIGLYAYKKSQAKPTEFMTFGASRYEILGGLVNATFLAGLCFTIFVSAFERFIDPEEIKDPETFMIVGSVGLFVNFIGIILFWDSGGHAHVGHGHDHGHGHGHSHNHSQGERSENEHGIFLHILGDFLGSVAVMVTGFVILFTNWKYSDYLDPAMSLFIALILFYSSAKLIKRTSAVVIESCPTEINISHLRQELSDVDGVESVHDLHVWELAQSKVIALSHIVLLTYENAQKVISDCTNIFMKYGIFNSTIQVELKSSFPEGMDKDRCSYASLYHADKRCFFTKPVYMHKIGCPHINTGHVHVHEESLNGDHNHGHDHSHCDGHNHDHSHNNLTNPQ